MNFNTKWRFLRAQCDSGQVGIIGINTESLNAQVAMFPGDASGTQDRNQALEYLMGGSALPLLWKELIGSRDAGGNTWIAEVDDVDDLRKSIGKFSFLSSDS